jgi:Domain of unknown function (DUF4386)
VGKQEQLQWERKWAPLAAGAAFVAALLPIASTIWASSLLGSVPSTNSEDIFLTRVHEHSSGYVAAGVISSIGTLALAPVLVFLYQAIKARRPQIPRIALLLAVAAPLVAAGAGVARQAVIANTANDYVNHPPPPAKIAPAEDAKLKNLRGKAYSDELEKLASKPARDKLKSGSVTTVAYIGLIANLLLGVAFVLVAMHAMRSGLLSRFMGILGVIVGALTAIPILGGAPVVQLFWLIAMAILFLNRWPQGRGPAWDAVEEIPWPTAQERRDAMPPAEPRGAGRARGAEREEREEPEPVEAQHTREAARPRQSSAHPRSKKRKRKRRG